MSADPGGFVWQWEWAPPFVAVLIAVEVAYVVLWARGGFGHRRSHLAWGHLVAFTAGLVAIVIALISPIGANDERLLSMHMLSHDLLIWIAAPLLLIGGLPLMGDTHRLPWIIRRPLAFLTRPVIAWLISTVLLWVWHAPSAYDLALGNPVVHGIEHLCFLAGYLLYWWPLTIPEGGVGWLRGNAARAIYLLAGMMQSALLGAILTFHRSVLYPAYLHAPGATPASALADQRLAGALMWFPGAAIFAVAAIFAIRSWTPQPVQGT